MAAAPRSMAVHKAWRNYSAVNSADALLARHAQNANGRRGPREEASGAGAALPWPRLPGCAPRTDRAPRQHPASQATGALGGRSPGSQGGARGACQSHTRARAHSLGSPGSAWGASSGWAHFHPVGSAGLPSGALPTSAGIALWPDTAGKYGAEP